MAAQPPGPPESGHPELLVGINLGTGVGKALSPLISQQFNPMLAPGTSWHLLAWAWRVQEVEEDKVQKG